MKKYIILDLEATCWRGCKTPEIEIIEIGALRLSARHLQPMSDFVQFVRPVENPILTEFCKKLTSIKQTQIDKAPTFGTAFGNFLNWIGTEPFKLCSWGKFDYDIILIECDRHGLEMPDNMIEHINLKELFCKVYDTKSSTGLRQAMNKLKLTFEGVHHRGIDDARNTAKIAQQVLILDDWRQ